MSRIYQNADGSQRPFTAEENALADAIAAQQDNPSPTPRQAARAKFDALPDEVRTPFLPAWVIVNQLIDLSGNGTDAVKHFDTLTIPQGYEQVAADIRADLLVI